MQTVTLLSHIKQFFAMGGYAFYVWAAYLLVILVLASVFWQALLRMQRLEKLTLQQNSLSDKNERKT